MILDNPQANGSVWAWGNNEAGQLGIGTNDIRVTTPVQVSALKNIVEISAGMDFSLALTADGYIYGWGNNEYDQLGSRRTSEHYTSPILIDDISGVKRYLPEAPGP
jgi:alpha-tubulin suppressor-like RCC1 family protein